MRASEFLQLSPYGICCPLCKGELTIGQLKNSVDEYYECPGHQHPTCDFQAWFFQEKVNKVFIRENRGLIDGRYYLSQQLIIQDVPTVVLHEAKKPLSSGKCCSYYTDLKVSMANFEIRRYSQFEIETMKIFS